MDETFAIEKAWTFLKDEVRLRGSTGAALRTLPDGRKVVVKRGGHKFGNEEAHLRNEYDFNRYLNELGIGVPHATLTEEHGRPTMLTEFEEGAKPIRANRDLSPTEDTPKLREDVVPHALIANWDVLGMDLDNVLRRPDGSLSYVDVGGSGAFTAQGNQKRAQYPRSNAFGADVSELESFQRHMPWVYGNLTPEEIGQSYDRYGGVDAMTDATKVVSDPQTQDVLQQRAENLARRVA